MTTHLVIADDDTLLRLQRATRTLVPSMGAHRDDRGRSFRHVDTGDRWLFRTYDSAPDPNDCRAHKVYGLRVDFLYLADDRPFAVLVPFGWTLMRHDYPVTRILPLIAACDLLGVDEL